VTTDNYAAEVCLGEALEGTGHPDEALAFYTDAVRIEPGYPLAQFKLGMRLLAARKPDEAGAHLSSAARLMPHNPDLQYDYGLFLRQQGDVAGAIARFKAALGDRPDFSAALNDLAWLLATTEDSRLRSGAEAVQLARQACELTQNRQAAQLTTLSAAYAETGRFPEAITTVQKAMELAAAAGQTDIAAQDGQLLKLYQTGNPCRETFNHHPTP
jgi:tetratricopeptide (TPR) repeat protein